MLRAGYRGFGMRGMAGVSSCSRSGNGKNIFGIPIDEKYKRKSRRHA